MKGPADKPVPEAGAAQVFLRCRDSLRRVVAGMGFGPTDADDILQDVFIEAVKGLPQAHKDEEAARWLIRVTVNRGMLEYRKRRRFRVAIGRVARVSPPAGDAGPEKAAILAEEFEAVRQAMEGLDSSLLVPLSLRYYSDMASSQIAEVLGIPASTVRSKIREARLFLAARLSARGIEP
jgi:RNA polymerase sigma-70 factor (ECF subfamily)